MIDTTVIRNHITAVCGIYCGTCGCTIKFFDMSTEYRINVAPECKHFLQKTSYPCLDRSMIWGVPKEVVLGYCIYKGNPDTVILITREMFIINTRRSVNSLADYIDKMSTAFVNDFWQYDCRISYN